MRCFDPRGLAAIAVSLALLSSAKASEPDAGPNLCFARVYDAQHMAAHPDQKIERIFFFHGADPVSRPNEEPPSSGSTGYSSFLATVVRGDKTPKWAGTGCVPDKVGQTVRCGMECDRTLGYITAAPKGELILSKLNKTLYLEPDADETLGKAEFARQSFGKGDDDFHLEPQPAETCKAEFSRIDPPNPALGAPLRERLGVDQPFCYGRDYDPSHLKSHPGQMTASIRIFRGGAQIANYHTHKTSDQWPDDADVIVSVTTRGNEKAITRDFVCQGVSDQWLCSAPAGCTGERREMYLRRDVKEGMLLVNPNSALELVDLCAPQGIGATKTDDKVFRVSPMPLSGCGL